MAAITLRWPRHRRCGDDSRRRGTPLRL